MLPQEILTANYKQAMRRLAATATIVTTMSDGKRHGMAATAVTSLSMDPPSLLVCVNRSASIHEFLALEGSFCVNILQPKHQDLCMAFGGKVDPEDRFNHGDWGIDAAGVPYLSDAAAQMFCQVKKRVEHGSHSIIVGDVYAANVTDISAPLIYGNGAFLSVA